MSLFRPSKPPVPRPVLRSADDELSERRSGADRRRSVEKRNGLAVLMAGCSKCDRIAPSPIEMQIEGWEMEWDEGGLVSITCPAHGHAENGSGSDLPDYIVGPDASA